MTPWDELVLAFPRLYSKEISFECGEGWRSILLSLSIKIESILEKCSATDMYAVQVKEKYGTLRFYMSKMTPEIAALVSDTEALSSQTCELCGHFGKMRGVNHIMVRCDKCFRGLEDDDTKGAT